MKLIYPRLTACIYILLFVFLGKLHAQSGIYESYIILDVNGAGNTYYDLNYDTGGNPNFSGQNLGTFTSSNTLILNGGQNKTYKCGIDNIFNSYVNYRIYRSGDTAPAFISSEMPWASNDGNSHCSGASIDQTWQTTTANINLLNGLTSGDYILEVYTHADYDSNNDNVIDSTHYISNFGANYIATFRVDTAPIANCISIPINVHLDASGTASITANDINNGSIDDFDTPILSIDTSTFDCNDIGNNTITLTVEDSLGQTDSCTATIRIIDGIPPTITCPADVTVNVDSGLCTASGVTLGTPTTNDNCTVDLVYNDAPTTFPIGTTNVTWVVRDSENNTTICPQQVTVIDNAAPTPDTTTLADVTAECEVTALTAPTATDNCGGTVTVTNDATLPISTQGTTIVTWTYDDGNGNTTTQTQNIVIDDVTAPTPDTATLADVTAECEVTALTAPTATDNCGGTVTVTNDATLPISTQGTTVVTWTYDDGNGNTSIQTQNIEIDDITAPTPDNATLADVTTECEVTTLTAPTATDNCGGTVTVTNDATLPISTQGTTVVTWTYDDGNGNTTTQTQNVVIDDVTAPTPDTATLADITTECEVTALTAPTATDNCGGTVTVTNDATLPISTQGTTVVTWTYDDGNGNTTTQTQNVVIDDVTAPTPDTATLADITTECEVTALTAPTATDNCGGTVTVTNDATLPISTQGTTVVTWTYDDGNGNTTTQTQNVVIDDVTAPTPDTATLADITTECEVTALTAPTATDNCGGTVTVTNDATLPISTQGTTVVTWTYDDGNGNTTTQTQNVVIDDVTAPTPDTATLADITTECEVTALTAPTATDNCGGTVTVTNDATLPISTQGTTVVTWTYDDGNGNTTTQTQNVVIDDVTAPTPDTATLADITTECEVTALTAPTATDNCGGTVTVTNDATLPISTQGTTVVTWTYDDGNGNTTTQTQNVVIDDVTAPTPDTATLADITTECEVTALTAPTATDNCGGTVTVTNDATLPISTQGTTIVTWTYDDGNGNTATQTQNIVIDDVTAPTISCPSDILTTNEIGLCTAVVTYIAPTGSDNCGIFTINQIAGLPSGSAFPVGTTINTFEIVDTGGNITTCSFNVTVNDNEAPTITCPSTLVVNADNNCESTTVVLSPPSTSDNCGIASVTNNAPSIFPLGNTTVTWTATDNSGLTSTCTQTVTVIDATPPTLTCPTPNALYLTDAGQCYSALSFTATASDNCNGAPILTYEVDGNPINFPFNFPVGTTTVNVIANDGNGQTTTCNFNVTVEDQEAPTMICQPLTITLDATGNASITATDIDNGSSDTCGISSLSIDQTNFDCSNIGNNTVTLTAIDNNGNAATCSTTVTILDYVQSATSTITASTSTTICQGTPVTFTSSNSNLGANPQYEWFVGGVSEGNNSPTFTTSGLNNGDDVYVEITSGPCNTVTASNSIVMTVNPLLPVSYTLNASNNPICSGENTTFFVTGLTNGGATPTYQWYVNGTPVGGNTNSYVSSSIADGDIISVDVSSSLACANPVPARESITMTVTPDATINLNSGNDNQTVCNGTAMSNIIYTIGNATNATITGIPTGITGNYTSGVFTISGTPTQTGVFNYTVIPEGCGSAIATGIISVGPDATINLLSSSENSSICNNNSDNLNLQFQLNSGASGATLSSSPALPAGITGAFDSASGIYTISGTTNQDGIYNYTITTTGCGSGESISGIITIYNGIPAAPGSIDGPSSFFCPVNQAVYSVVPDPNVENYNWTVSAGLSIQSGQGTNEIVVSVNGLAINETISVSASNACGTSSTTTDSIFFNFTASDIDAGNDIYICAGTTSVQMNGDDGGLDYDEWTWDDNGAGGSFSTHYLGQTRNWSWGCWCYVYNDIYDYTETSTYTIPATAQPGDIITISLIADNWFWCDPLESTMRIHILEEPEAEIISSDVTLCEGESTTIIFSGTPGARIRYNDGSGNTNVNLNASGNYSLAVSPTTTTTYTLNRVRYTNGAFPGNGNNCDVYLNESVTITVNEPPTVTAPNDITICEGDTVDLSSANINGTNHVGSWSSSGTGTFGSGIYTPSAADIFNGSVTLTYTNTPSDGICPTVSDSMVVTINQLPVVNAGVNQTICSDGSIILNGTIGGSTSAVTWSAPSGVFSNINDLNATYTPAISNGTITLTLTSNDPAGPCGPDIDTVVITVNQAATVYAGIDSIICSEDTVDLSTANFGGSATTATWASSGSGVFSSGLYTPSAADIANGSVTLTYTTNNPVGICNAVSDSIVITINEAASVNAGNDISTCANMNTVTLNATTNTSGNWSGGTGIFADSSSPTTTYTLGTGETSGTVTLSFTTVDPDNSGPCSSASDSVNINITPYVTANANNLTAINTCSDTTIQLQANGSGQWTAISIPAGSTYTFSNPNDPNATFTGESGIDYTITWTIDNASPCADNSDSFSVSFPNCGNYIDFDGVDDYVSFGNNHDVSGSFSFESWIKPHSINGQIQTIFSKRDANNLSTGYDLRLVNNTISFHANGTSISANGITSNRWHHIAVTFDGSNYKLYVDGIDMNTRLGPNPTSNSYAMLLGAMHQINDIPTNHFNGWLDEIRVWNIALTTAQIREMMNQEIEANGTSVRGTVLGLDISGLAWTNLTAYYQMNQGIDITAGNLADNSATSTLGNLVNMTTLQDETAPLPYISNQNGIWNNANTWLNGNVQSIPNSNGINGNPINWNIVRVQHDVTSGNRATTVLGLLVDTNRYSITNNQRLDVTKYLKIDGVLDLVDESQLLQPNGSMVDYSATGYIERDQQGTNNVFNYNYWGSPVSSAGISGARTYTVGDILYDSNTQALWTGGYNGSSSPLTISNRWIYAFAEGAENAYSDWIYKGQNGSFDAALGFTMKGSGTATATQNYTFRGLPNNADIETSVSASATLNHQTLVGNPYPSAIDAQTFIRDNIPGGNAGTTGSIDGTLYFWKQSSTNNTHLTVDYQGGYATYNLSGGNPAVSPPEINGVGDASATTPKRFVPVAQGFFVTSANLGDQVTNTVRFKNTQRAFVKETSGNSEFFKNAPVIQQRNETDEITDDIQRVRLQFKTPEGATRPLLLAFTPDNAASDDFDYGYDAENADFVPNDMSFVIENKKYVTQGVGSFDSEKRYPLAIDLANNGNIEVSLVDLENFDETITVYLHDALLGTYTLLNTIDYSINLDAGNYENRYFITFEEDQTLHVTETSITNTIVNYLNSSNEIYIKVPNTMTVKQVYLINILGQTVKSWNASNAPISNECKLPVEYISEGNYIIKVQTNNQATINKKIIVKY
ncbi:HYR domain-containing protein [Corallibacter sp.]|uniref:HYR domain-containing protein n=1 Tax=Corallibacter sp. TaxID=2038084 RepID=UPI003AB7EAE0